MKSTDLIQPLPMVSPIANQGAKFNIPQNPTSTGLASVVEGFPEITMKSLKEGGLPPRGQDANGMFYLSTDQRVYLQNGGIITFSQEVSDLIGGYPKNAVLDYIDENNAYCKVQSLIDDNTNNFVENPSLIDDVNWKKVDFGAVWGQISGNITDQADLQEALNNKANKAPWRMFNHPTLANIKSGSVDIDLTPYLPEGDYAGYIVKLDYLLENGTSTTVFYDLTSTPSGTTHIYITPPRTVGGGTCDYIIGSDKKLTWKVVDYAVTEARLRLIACQPLETLQIET